MNIDLAFRSILVALLFLSCAVCQDEQPNGDSPEAALAQAPSHPARDQLNQAVEQFRQGNADAAMKLLVAISKKYPDLSPGEVLFAQVAFRTNQIVAGRQALEIAVINSPNDPEAWNMIAELAFREGRVAESSLAFGKSNSLAQQMATNVDRRKPQLSASLAGLAKVAQAREDWSTAEGHLRQWTQIQPENFASWEKLAFVLFKLDRIDESKACLNKSRQLQKSQPIAEVALGSMYFSDGDHQRAGELMREAIAKAGDDMTTCVAVARWALLSGEIDLMEQCLEKAKPLKADSVTVDALAGMAARFKSQHGKAEEIFAKMLEANPASFDASNGLALALLDQPEPEKHQKALQLTNVLVRSHEDLKTERGRAAAAAYARALNKTGRPSQAKAVIKRVIASGEISPEIGFFAAEILAESGNSQLARSLLTNALASPVAFPYAKAARKLLTGL